MGGAGQITYMYGPMDSSFPTREVIKHTKDTPWVADRFKLLVGELQGAWAAGNLPRVRRLRNQVNKLGSSLRQRFYLRKIASATSPSGSTSWWNSVKSLMGSSRSASPLIQMVNTLCNGDQRKLADSISSFFQSVNAHLTPLTPDSQYSFRSTVEYQSNSSSA